MKASGVLQLTSASASPWSWWGMQKPRLQTELLAECALSYDPPGDWCAAQSLRSPALLLIVPVGFLFWSASLQGVPALINHSLYRASRQAAILQAEQYVHNLCLLSLYSSNVVPINAFFESSSALAWFWANQKIFMCLMFHPLFPKAQSKEKSMLAASTLLCQLPSPLLPSEIRAINTQGEFKESPLVFSSICKITREPSHFQQSRK